MNSHAKDYANNPDGFLDLLADMGEFSTVTSRLHTVSKALWDEELFVRISKFKQFARKIIDGDTTRIESTIIFGDRTIELMVICIEKYLAGSVQRFIGNIEELKRLDEGLYAENKKAIEDALAGLTSAVNATEDENSDIFDVVRAFEVAYDAIMPHHDKARKEARERAEAAGRAEHQRKIAERRAEMSSRLDKIGAQF